MHVIRLYGSAVLLRATASVRGIGATRTGTLPPSPAATLRRLGCLAFRRGLVLGLLLALRLSLALHVLGLALLLGTLLSLCLSLLLGLLARPVPRTPARPPLGGRLFGRGSGGCRRCGTFSRDGLMVTTATGLTSSLGGCLLGTRLGFFRCLLFCGLRRSRAFRTCSAATTATSGALGTLLCGSLLDLLLLLLRTLLGSRTLRAATTLLRLVLDEDVYIVKGLVGHDAHLAVELGQSHLHVR